MYAWYCITSYCGVEPTVLQIAEDGEVALSLSIFHSFLKLGCKGAGIAIGGMPLYLPIQKSNRPRIPKLHHTILRRWHRCSLQKHGRTHWSCTNRHLTSHYVALNHQSTEIIPFFSSIHRNVVLPKNGDAFIEIACCIDEQETSLSEMQTYGPSKLADTRKTGTGILRARHLP